MAAVYIKQGTGFLYNRGIYNLYKSGVKTIPALKKRWLKINHNLKDDGKIPQTKTDHASDARNKQESYVVARKSSNQEFENKIDRTHLIPFPVTGIEHHKGLLVDFDAELNRGGMNNFERKALNLSNYKDIIWVALVYPTNDNFLAIREIAFDKNWHILGNKCFIDKSHRYYWYNDI